MVSGRRVKDGEKGFIHLSIRMFTLANGGQERNMV
jgi:hypothetical protein